MAGSHVAGFVHAVGLGHGGARSEAAKARAPRVRVRGSWRLLQKVEMREKQTWVPERGAPQCPICVVIRGQAAAGYSRVQKGAKKFCVAL